MKICDKCGFENRPMAIYCRDCGHKLEAVQPKEESREQEKPEEKKPDNKEKKRAEEPRKADALDVIVGLDSFKKQIRDKAQQFKIINSCVIKGKKINVPFDAVIIGDSGYGKTALAAAITQYLFDNKVISKKQPVTVDSFDDKGFVEAYNNAKGGVLVVDKMERVIPEDAEKYKNTVVYENLVRSLGEVNEDEEERPIVIFCGNSRFKEYMANHSVYSSNFTFIFELPSISISDLVEITKKKLESDFSMAWSDEALAKLRNVYSGMLRDTSVPFGYGHATAKKARQIMQEFASRMGNSKSMTIMAEHVPGKEFKPKTFDEVIAEFDKFVGVEDIKKTLKQIATTVERKRRDRAEDDDSPLLKDNYRFLGNPGTGKTTMARLFADALAAMGVLSVGQLVEVSRKDLVGQWQGTTAPLVEDAFNRADGGVLFIDEAYDLKHDQGDSFGSEAVNTLLKLAEDRKGRVVVIIAGYLREMDIFKDANPGIKSRFNVDIFFRDYKAEELEEIFRRMVKGSGFTLDESAEKGLPGFFKTMLQRTQKKDFGNAREVRNAFDAAEKRQALRIDALRRKGELDPAKERELIMADIEGEESKPKSMEEVMSSLDDLVGMANVKTQIQSIANAIKGVKRRMRSGLGKDELQNIHIVITGNPGTGKTTVAKRLGEVFKALGVLTTDKLVERDRSNLVTQWVNSGANNMNAAVDEAMGGILFIDEAYTLYNPKDSTGDKHGLEAVEALMKRMSDDKGKFVTVIAGYKREIEWFINNANPGLKRRFTYWVNIDDYTEDQLVEIFMRTAKSRNYTLTPGAVERVKEKVKELVENKEPNFGNAGVMVNFFSKTLERQSNRLSPLFDDESVDDKLFFIIEEEDIPMDFTP